MAQRHEWFFITILIAAAGVLIFFLFSFFFGMPDGDDLELSGAGRIGLVEIKGVIIDSERTVKLLERFREDGSIQAVLLRIDSPGGGVAASQEIYEAVKRVRDSGKFVIASMASVAASGGYYIACGADTIMANPGTTTGSIGVVAEMMDVSDLLRKIGIQFNIIKSGTYKDSGTPFRKMTEEDRRYLQKYVNDAYQQFVAVVAKERDLEFDQVLEYADGRIYTGQQAKDIRLIDLLGTYNDAIELAAQAVGVEGRPRLVTERRQRRLTLWDLLFGDLEEHLTRLQSLPVLRYQMVL
jgi:protease-4